jgi:hypothetical protein
MNEEFKLEEGVEDNSEEAIINFELSPFNLLANEYDNFELRDKVFEKNASYALYVYP